ncbi:MAG: GNAT family N-acetyltransferase [Gemmatimonadaceae bacterium]
MASYARSLDLPPNAWYLSILGVHPSLQGRGVGSRLVRRTLEELDRNGAPSYLETYTASAVCAAWNGLGIRRSGRRRSQPWDAGIGSCSATQRKRHSDNAARTEAFASGYAKAAVAPAADTVAEDVYHYLMQLQRARAFQD